MTEFRMKCPECGNEFSGQSNNLVIVCPSCKKEVNTNQAIKYYQSLKRIETENVKIAEGEKYIKVNAILDECQWYLDNGDFDSAINHTNEALKLTTVDGRVYLMRVYAKTKNFTDFTENSHFSDLKKALELSTAMEKENIKRIYSAYHKKRNIPKEELDEYESQEADSKLKRVENLLKDGIPKHFEREKALKTLIPLTAVLILAVIVTFILTIALNDTVISIITAVLFVIAFILFTITHTAVKRVKIYNAALDLFDNYLSFELQPSVKLEFSKSLEKLAVSYYNGESISKYEALLFEILEVLSENTKAIKFITQNKTLKKFI